MLLTVGRVVRPHGVRGEVVVEAATDEPGQRFAAGTVLRAQAPGPPPADPAAWRVPSQLTVTAARPHQDRWIVAFDEVGDRNVAEAVRGVWLQVDSDALPAPADPDEYHDHQLTGLAAVDRDGAPVGSVTGVEHQPGAELLVLSLPDGREARVPFVAALVPEVDLAAGRVVCDLPEGLLEL